MPRDLDNPIDVIAKFLKHHVPGASVVRLGDTTRLEVTHVGKRVVLYLDPTQLSDLEQALTDKALPPRYKNGVIHDNTVRALVAAGKEGMAPDVVVSKLLVDERLDWDQPRARLVTSFDADTAKKLQEGLKALDTHAASLVASDVPVPSIQKEREVMAPIIEYYNKTGHLDEVEVSGESLSYLKGAALCWILELEQRKAATTSPRVRTGLSIKIFEVMEQFWLLTPWNRIPLPPIIDDYLPHRAAAQKDDAGKGPRPSLDIGPALKLLDQRLEERWRGAWVALRCDNPDKVSQGANSMVEVLDKVIDRVCHGRKFKDVLAERFPKQEKVVLAQRAYVSALKDSLHGVKHETKPQSVHTAEDLMHAAEGIIRTLLR